MTSSTRRDVVKRAILHEKQEEGSMLCAQHALNNLQQGTFFDAAQLAEIAAQLDGLERENLDMSDSEWGDREAGGRNADETGFFSVGVIETALEVWGLSLLRWNSADMRQFHDAPEQQLAFILNLQSHWFSFRSFGWSGDLWFNLNSFLEEPSWVGAGYLGALLSQSQTEGYSVFVVRPTSSDPEQVQSILSQIRSCTADVAASSSHHVTLGSDSDEDEEVKKALAASLASPDVIAGAASHCSAASEGESSKVKARRKGKRQGDDDLQEALLASMKASSSSRGPSAGPSRLANGPGGAKRGGSSSHRGSTRDMPIDLDDDSGDDARAQQVEAARSPFLNPVLRNHFLQEAFEGDEVDDLDTLDSPATDRVERQTLSTGTPPAVGQHDVIEILSDDEQSDGGLEEQGALAFGSATAGFRDLRDRDYDDEDAELQRALAASMAEPSSSGAEENGRDPIVGASAEEQAEIMAAIASARDQRSRTPDDVGRITRMRKEAELKEREDRERTERRSRGVLTPEPANDSKSREEAGGEGSGDEEEEEEEEEEAKQMSPEELRKMRLARFGM